MRWYRNLYLGDNAKKAKYKVVWKIISGKKNISIKKKGK